MWFIIYGLKCDQAPLPLSHFVDLMYLTLKSSKNAKNKDENEHFRRYLTECMNSCVHGSNFR